ncbi:branched-chain amino acid transport system ATP-binding protein [Azospirillum agricola]|uniref:ABC transporter ATP-binding protein n=1 Tax=Azospirillum agricola TaxID=1720247 RepID=UPI001AE310C6|nr:ABC transporter ATP-binding protein [Azospirillum agricola]MBP2228816.1 branched-chain amino acid transport system ATP-binding protein [Azospirillum agricola]
MLPPILETHGLNKSFGALTVAQNINFSLEPGTFEALIGPNGAGKSTFVNLLTGLIPPTSGSVILDGQDVTALPIEARVKRGMVRTFQINTLFNSLTVAENVILALDEHHNHGWRPLPSPTLRRVIREEAYGILDRLGLAPWGNREVKSLPYGRQRLVEIAIALALRPKVLLLDEPAAGIPSTETGTIIEVLESLASDLAILIIEHDMDLVFRFAQRITVLVQGAVLARGTPDEIANNETVKSVYLGEGIHA